MLNLAFSLLAQDTPPPSFQGGGGGGGIVAMVFMVVYLAILVMVIASLWKVFAKAGEPGWAAIVPIYNLIVLLKVAGKPLWMIILFFLPLLNLIAAVMVAMGVAERFGKSAGFAIGLFFLPFIFYPMLAFGDATWTPAPTTA